MQLDSYSGLSPLKEECQLSRVCPARLAPYLNNSLRKLIHNPKKIMGDYVNEGDTVADIGCGPGFFSVALAEMVGASGRVISVDLQREMLDRFRASAGYLRLRSRIVLHQCQEDRLGIEEKVNFVLAFWMVHEVPNMNRFFDEIVSTLKPGGLFMMIEPRMHVDTTRFQQEIAQASAAGLKPCKELGVSISRGMLFSLA